MEALVQTTFFNAVLLGGLLMAQPLTRVSILGWGYGLSSMDTRVDEGRFSRRLAMVKNNQLEALVFFVPIVLLARWHALDHPHLPAIALAFAIGRTLYAAVSLAGIPVARTLSFGIGFLATNYLAWLVWMSF